MLLYKYCTTLLMLSTILLYYNALLLLHRRTGGSPMPSIKTGIKTLAHAQIRSAGRRFHLGGREV